MIVYRVSVTVDTAVEPQWLQWMLEKHIPDVLRTGCFDDACTLKREQENAQTYVIEYTTTSRARLEHYQRVFAPDLQEDHRLKYGEHVKASREILALIKNVTK